MLGRKDYTKEEFDHAEQVVDHQVAAYKKLVQAVGRATSDPKVWSASDAFEPLFFNNMVLVLDQLFAEIDARFL